MINSPVILKNIGVLCALFLCVACNEEEAHELKSEISELNDELREAKNVRNALIEKEKDLKRLIFNFDRMQKKEREIRMELGVISDYHRDLKAGFDYASALVDRWKVATRKSLIGEKLGLVRLADKTLEGAVIVDLDAEKVVLKHSDGQDAVELADLPEDMRKQLIHEATILLEAEIVK